MRDARFSASGVEIRAPRVVAGSEPPQPLEPAASSALLSATKHTAEHACAFPHAADLAKQQLGLALLET